MGEMEISLRVGGELTLALPDGTVATCTVTRMTAGNGIGPDWTSTTPLIGRVTLAFQPGEPRSGTWAQDAGDGTPTLARGSVIEAPAPLPGATGERRPRLRSCVEAWPECSTGEYNPACCRFPKSCSADIYDEGSIGSGDLEAMTP